MKRIVLGLLSMVALMGVSNAAQVGEGDVRRAATKFWNTYRPSEAKQMSADEFQTMHFDGIELVSVLRGRDGGFVVMSREDIAYPVLAYSFEERFPDTLHSSLRYWLEGYQSEIVEAGIAGVEADEETQAEWRYLLGEDNSREGSKLSKIDALVHTKWDQGEPYNRLCPNDEQHHQRTVVGCVATAMAQIIRYWEHPLCGTGEHAYEPRAMGNNQSAYGELYADFANTTYKYGFMPDMLDQWIASQAEIDAVATLSYHCGVAVDMMYGPSATGGSGAYSYCGAWTNACAVSAFVDYFRYKPTIKHCHHYNYSDSAWRAMIEENLSAGRPMYYSGRDSSSGHAFVLDGVDEQRRYHFNWGWSGYGDGFYRLTSMNPGGGGAGGNATYTFRLEQSAIFDIEPDEVHIDTIQVYDTVCSGVSTYSFGEYDVSVSGGDYMLPHLDTMFSLHLSVASPRFLYLDPNGGTGTLQTYRYCFLEGAVLPECQFEKEGFFFNGWSFTRDGAEVYLPGDTLHIRRNSEVFAIWGKYPIGVQQARPLKVQLWPNPTTGKVRLRAGEGEECRVYVFDAVGRMQTSAVLSTGEGEIDLSNLAEGMYLLQAVSGESVYNGRIIKK